MNERKKREIVLLENLEPGYASLDEKKQIMDQGLKDVEGRKQVKIQAGRVFEQANQIWLKAREDHQQTREKHTTAQRHYLNGISGILARELKTDEPCPVCGSTTHPISAKLGENSITIQQLDNYAAAENAAKKAEDDAHQRYQQAEKQKEDAVTAYNQACSRADQAKHEYDNVAGQKQSGIEELKQLQKAIQLLREDIESYAVKSEALQVALMTANGNHKSAQDDWVQKQKQNQQVESQLAVAQQNWQEHLAASGLESEKEYQLCLLSSEEKERKREKITQLESSLKDAKAALTKQQADLAGKEKPDLEKCKQQWQFVAKLQEEKNKASILIEQELLTIKTDLAELTERQKRYQEQHQIVDGNLEFSNRLSPKSGQSLQRYVPGVMLSSITAEANHLLQGVHGGRYRLYRTNEKSSGSNHTGLELEVSDNQSGQRRSVTTLSGGEKFLVALSLAIGLSTVVQAQGRGIRIEAMFVDEGFGSLDKNSITDDLEILQVF